MISNVMRRTRFGLINWLLLPCLCLATCPPLEELTPNCYSYDTDYGCTLSCKNIFDPMELYAPIGATVGYKMLGLTLTNSTLRFLTHDLFHNTNYQEVRLMNTQLLSLSDGELALEGLENYLTEIRAIATHYISQWEFSQLRKLKKLKIIEINSVYIKAMAEDFPEFPELTILGLTDMGLSYITDNAFAKCLKLTILALNSNKLSEMKRSMLPNPANSLKVINLMDNDLKTLPDDFFTNMPALTDVYLNNNHFVTLDESVFDNIFSYIKALSMNGNPIQCDCRLFWLQRKRMPMSLSVKCTAPTHLAGLDLQAYNPDPCR